MKNAKIQKLTIEQILKHEGAITIMDDRLAAAPTAYDTGAAAVRAIYDTFGVAECADLGEIDAAISDNVSHEC